MIMMTNAQQVTKCKKHSAEMLDLKGNTSNLTSSGLIDECFESATFLT